MITQPNSAVLDELLQYTDPHQSKEENTLKHYPLNKTAPVESLKPIILETRLLSIQNTSSAQPMLSSTSNKSQFGNQKPFSVAKIGLQRSEIASLNALSYHRKELTSVPQEVLDKQSTLNLLDLTSNRFVQFPSELLQLTNLKVLRIDHNKIKTLPKGIEQLQSLECFTLSCNLLQFFPSTFSQLNCLIELNFEFNLIDNIDPQIVDLKNLRFVNMSRNRFTQFPSAFFKMSNLIDLNFEWFKYANPPLPSRQRGREGEMRIQKLRDACEKIASTGQKGIDFLEFIRLVSIQEPSLDFLDDMQRSFLHYASLSEDISVMKYLILHKPFLLNLADLEGHTPLSLSISREKYLSARYLLKHGVNPAKGGGNYSSPLHIATRKLNFQIVRDIVNMGENMNRIDVDGNTPLHLAISRMSEETSRAASIAQFLLENGANPNARDKEGWTPLHLAVRKKDLKTLHWIFHYNKEAQEVHGREKVFNLNKRGGIYDWTSLHIACNAESFYVLEALTQSGCDPFRRCLHGGRPKALVRVNGVMLKAIEKCERSWIHTKVLLVRNRNDTDFVDDSNLKSLHDTRAIRNASKNKFDSPLHRNAQDSPNLSYISHKSKDQKSIIVRKLTYKNFNDSFEINPETEANDFDGDVTTEIIGNKFEFLQEPNENISFEEETCNHESAPRNRINVIEPVNSTRTPPHARFTAGTVQLLEKDIADYESYLNNDGKFSIEFAKNEVITISELFQMDRLLFTEKMKLFTMLKMLMNKILDHLQTVLKVGVNKESLAIFCMKSQAAINFKNSQHIRKKSDMRVTTVFYELVPQCLIDLFSKFSANSYENTLFKNTIIYMFVEFHYYPAIEFLETIQKKSSESYLVKQEAKQAAQTLANLYELYLTYRIASRFCNSLQGSPHNFEKPRSIKPQINAFVEETLQSPLLTEGPSFHSKPVFQPIKVADQSDKAL